MTEEKDKELGVKFILGSMMHFGSLLIALGMGYYIGWGFTLISWGMYWIIFMLYKIISLKKKGQLT